MCDAIAFELHILEKGLAVRSTRTGSIWLPMLAYEIPDVVKGEKIVKVLRDTDNFPRANRAGS